MTTREAAFVEKNVSAKFVGVEVKPGTNLISHLFYIRGCVRSTTIGPKILTICEGTISKTFWENAETYDYYMHFVSGILLAVMCFMRVAPLTLDSSAETVCLWLFLFGPVLLHCLLMIWAMMTLGLRLSSALKFALFFFIEDLPTSMTNDFLEITAENKAGYAYSDEQTFIVGLMRSEAVLKIMVYGKAWKRTNFNFQCYFNCLHHIMMVIVIILSALSGADTNPTYLFTYMVWYIVYWVMVCDCNPNDKDNGILGVCICAGKLAECSLHILLCPLLGFCHCCCVASMATIKQRAQQSATIEDAVSLEYHNRPSGARWL